MTAFNLSLELSSSISKLSNSINSIKNAIVLIENAFNRTIADPALLTKNITKFKNVAIDSSSYDLIVEYEDTEELTKITLPEKLRLQNKEFIDKSKELEKKYLESQLVLTNFIVLIATDLVSDYNETTHDVSFAADKDRLNCLIMTIKLKEQNVESEVPA